MITFEIRDNEQDGRLLGYLLYYERSKRYFTELMSDVDEWTCPFIFSGFVRKGVYSIDSVWSRKFVGQRVIPVDRQNLGVILRENGLKEYDENKLLLLSEGRCSQDELYLVRISEKEIVPEIKKRFISKIVDVMALRDLKVLVFFKDSKSVIVDIGKLCKENRLYGNILRNDELFQNVRVSPGGHGIEWGEEHFISSEILHREGKSTPVAYDDIIGFVRNRLVDTAETTKILNCSRQYIKQLSDKKRIVSVREGANSNLYLKSDIERE